MPEPRLAEDELPRRNALKAAPLKRKPWGQDRRVTYQTEAAFQAQVEELAGVLGWWCFHLRQPMRSPAGFPDLVLFRERVIFAELKVRSPNTGRAGKLETPQIEMAHRCFAAGAEYYAWWSPDDWDELVAVLERGRVV